MTILWQVFAIHSGGEPGARLLKVVGTTVSPDSLLRLAKKAIAEDPVIPEILGMDDFAFRRGLTYGTLLIDWQRPRPIDLLPDRTAETLAKWLRAHPGVKWVSRDRVFRVRAGGSEGAPEAQKVMDRWSPSKNLRETLEGVTGRVYPRLKQRQEHPRSAPFPKRKKARTVHEQAVSDASRQGRLARYEEMLACYQQGLSITQIVKQVQLTQATVLQVPRH